MECEVSWVFQKAGAYFLNGVVENKPAGDGRRLGGGRPDAVLTPIELPVIVVDTAARTDSTDPNLHPVTTSSAFCHIRDWTYMSAAEFD